VIEIENDEGSKRRRQKALFGDSEDEEPVLSRMTSFSDFYNLEEEDNAK